MKTPTTIPAKIKFAEAKLAAAQRMLEKAEKARNNPRNYYSPKREIRIKWLNWHVKWISADLRFLGLGEDVDLNTELYDLKT
jgi:hypothetical protein